MGFAACFRDSFVQAPGGPRAQVISPWSRGRGRSDSALRWAPRPSRLCDSGPGPHPWPPFLPPVGITQQEDLDLLCFYSGKAQADGSPSGDIEATVESQVARRDTGGESILFLGDPSGSWNSVPPPPAPRKGSRGHGKAGVDGKSGTAIGRPAENHCRRVSVPGLLRIARVLVLRGPDGDEGKSGKWGGWPTIFRPSAGASPGFGGPREASKPRLRPHMGSVRASGCSLYPRLRQVGLAAQP